MKTGLSIFNNSFQKVAGWEFKLERLRLDMESLWTKPEPQENWGHVTANSAKLNTLKSASWLPSNLNLRCYDVRGVYLVQWRIEHGVMVKSFDDFLRHAADFDTVEFQELPANLTNNRLELPTRPGVLAMLAMADFLRALAAAKLDQDQIKPVVSWCLDTEIKLVIKLPTANQKVTNLARMLLDGTGSPGGAAATLRQYINCQIAMLDYLLKNPSPIKLGDIADNNQSLRNEVLTRNGYHQIHPQRTFPQFSGEEIVFWFKPAIMIQFGA